MMGIRLTDSDVDDDLVVVMPLLLGMTNPLVSDGRAREASKNCKRILICLGLKLDIVLLIYSLQNT